MYEELLRMIPTLWMGVMLGLMVGLALPVLFLLA